jgi:hypothetical protein
MSKGKFNLEIPINHLGFGQIGYGIAYELFQRNLEPNIFPIGNIELKAFKHDENFNFWLKECIENCLKDFQDYPTIRLWHLLGSERTLGKERKILYTAHETDQLTEVEREICRGYDEVFVTSDYTTKVFNANDVPAKTCYNFYDSRHIYNLNREYKGERPIIFTILGKMEKRKNTRNAAIAWANKYAGKKEFHLHCIIFNPFLNPEQQNYEFASWFGGKVPFNIQLIPFQETNAQLNELMDVTDIALSLSGAEGFDLPCLNFLCLGKQSIVLDAHAHQTYANSENSILVKSDRMLDIADGVFFQKDGLVNVGNMYNFTQESAWEAMDEAVSRVQSEIINEKGKELAEKFSVKNTVDTLLAAL